MSKELFSVSIPIKLPSAANFSEHWANKSKRHKSQCNWVLAGIGRHRHHIPLPCKVILTRVSPRKLDDDNLAFAFKNIRDFVADLIIPGLAPGRADGDPRITWQYEQKKEKDCKIIITVIT